MVLPDAPGDPVELQANDIAQDLVSQRVIRHDDETTEQSRRAYREMLFTAPGAAELISGVILQDETIRQRSSAGIPLAV